MNDLLFIAEIGSNWFGSIEIAKYLMDKAKESGATHAKFQLFKADDLYKPDWEYYSHAKKCELSYDTARELKEYADSIGIGWFASVHTKEDIDFLVDIKAPFIKIKASQFEDYDLLRYIQETGDIKRTIISIPHDGILFTHTLGKHIYTTPKYPSKFEDIDFAIMKNYSGFHGFSDHTQGIQASLCAAMYSNIRIFEKHFSAILEAFNVDSVKTPDWCVSIYPNQFKEMVEKIKHIKGE